MKTLHKSLKLKDLITLLEQKRSKISSKIDRSFKKVQSSMVQKKRKLRAFYKHTKVDLNDLLVDISHPCAPELAFLKHLDKKSQQKQPQKAKDFIVISSQGASRTIFRDERAGILTC
jgi:hypothetical protein